MADGASLSVGAIVPDCGSAAAFRLAITPADASDHVGVYCFLNSVYDGPSLAEFRASVEEPSYQPTDRLLARLEQRIVAHAQVVFRECLLGPLPLRTAQLDWLAIAPKLQGRGLGMQLARAAEGYMVRRGAMVAWARTPASSIFANQGWIQCGQTPPSRGNAHEVLGRLMEQGLYQPGRRAKLHIRPRLAWEVDRLSELYRENMAGLLGPAQRSEAYWRWLMQRHAFDQFYVAIEGPELIDLDEAKSSVVGYAAVKDRRILELAASGGRCSTAGALLARVCHDAMEAGRWTVSIHAPAADRLHGIFQTPDGPCRDAWPDCSGPVMAKVLQPMAFLRGMKDLLPQRAAAGGLPRKLELGIQVGEKRYRLAITHFHASLQSRQPARDTIVLGRCEFSRMLLGRWDWESAAGVGCFAASTPEALHYARVLFPAVPFWKPPLDDLKRDKTNPY